jgi:hypothetical protein
MVVNAEVSRMDIGNRTGKFETLLREIIGHKYCDLILFFSTILVFGMLLIISVQS